MASSIVSGHDLVGRCAQGRFYHSSFDVDRLLAALLAVRQQALSGTLEASRGGSSLGLTRGVADWIDSRDASILKAVAEVERIYRRQAGA